MNTRVKGLGTVYSRQLQSRQHTNAITAKIRARVLAKQILSKQTGQDAKQTEIDADNQEDQVQTRGSVRQEVLEAARSTNGSFERGSSDVWSPVVASPVSSQFKTTITKPTFADFAVKVKPTIQLICPRSERLLLRSESVGRDQRIRGAIIYPEPPEVRVKIRKLSKGLAGDQVYCPNYGEILKRTSIGILPFNKMSGRGAPKAVKPNTLKHVLPLPPVRNLFDGSVNTLCGYDQQTPRERDQKSPYPAYLQKGYGSRTALGLPNQKSHELNGHSLLTPIAHTKDNKTRPKLSKPPKHKLQTHSDDETDDGRPLVSRTAREIARMLHTLRGWRPLEQLRRPERAVFGVEAK